MKNERNPIDDLFRKGLEGLETNPAPRRRDLFLEEASMPVKRTNNRKYFFLFALLALLLAGVGIISYHALYKVDEDLSPVKSDISQPALSTEVHSNAITNSPADSPEIISEKPHLKQTKSSIYVNTSIITRETISVSDTAVTIIPENIISGEMTEIAPAEKSTENFTHAQQKDSVSNEVPIDWMDSTKTNNTEKSVIVTSPSSPSPPSRKTRDWSISAGIQYTPEWMFNTIDEGKFVNNFGIEGSVEFGRYSVRTGVGLSIAKGITEIAIGYNDYLGSYKQLDSITFAWDEKHYHLLPTYYLTDADVWDSLMKLDYPKIEKRYMYLQIPLILGYDFLQKNRFTMGVRIGPVLSILVSSQELTEDYDPGKNRIVQMNQVTPDRIQTNWQVMGGISASYRMSDRFRIELEPEARYYFNSVYEKGGLTQKPWSVGMRTAIIFSF